MISSVLSKVREAVGQICMKELSRQNAPLIMATCGSKGCTQTAFIYPILVIEYTP